MENINIKIRLNQLPTFNYLTEDAEKKKRPKCV